MLKLPCTNGKTKLAYFVRMKAGIKTPEKWLTISTNASLYYKTQVFFFFKKKKVRSFTRAPFATIGTQAQTECLPQNNPNMINVDGGEQLVNSRLCGQKWGEEWKKGGKPTETRPPPPVYKFPSFPPLYIGGIEYQGEGRTPRTTGPSPRSKSFRESSWLISSSSTTSQGMPLLRDS
jgi:hypothetical protein